MGGVRMSHDATAPRLVGAAGTVPSHAPWGVAAAQHRTRQAHALRRIECLCVAHANDNQITRPQERPRVQDLNSRERALP
jgi:hypothetical protein